MKGPDSEALRSRRSRAHRRGDHTLCIEDRCGHAGIDTRSVAAIEGESVASAVAEFVDKMPPGPAGGAQTVMGRVALRLAKAIDGDPPSLPGLCRELGVVMGQLGETGEDESQLDEVRARRAARRVELLIGTASEGEAI
ncbi:hypothetical protein [Streptomyces gobiensis]|uniref:hypothetical protein n=1 Tax=Streptomyces gobiensis TaxID=2875706 RepID=UPI001E635F97|nr:hypothetical protein [Streptomyces gobiensis]UGY93408.1 hypothetical protein test1122_17925 [Streptomyces gobiensis]